MSRAPKRGRPRQFKERYDRLNRSLLAIGYIFPGSVVKRFMSCGKSYCRCAGDPCQRHGPYYEWTRKVGGKTATMRLTAQQARLCSVWIANRRKLKKILNQMQAVSLQAARTLADVGSRR